MIRHVESISPCITYDRKHMYLLLGCCNRYSIQPNLFSIFNLGLLLLILCCQASAWMVVACVLLAPILLTDGQGIRKWANYFKPSIGEGLMVVLQPFDRFSGS